MKGKVSPPNKYEMSPDMWKGRCSLPPKLLTLLTHERKGVPCQKYEKMCCIFGYIYHGHIVAQPRNFYRYFASLNCILHIGPDIMENMQLCNWKCRLCGVDRFTQKTDFLKRHMPLFTIQGWVWGTATYAGNKLKNHFFPKSIRMT